MPGLELTVDLTKASTIGFEKLLSYLGLSEETVAFQEKLRKITRISTENASKVQCIGMDRPVPITQIYQQTRLSTGSHSNKRDVELSDFFKDDLEHKPRSGVIMGAPGAGKTTFLHWTLLYLIGRSRYTPILFSLRAHEAPEELFSFISDVSEIRKNEDSSEKLVLLVDGYDEIDPEARKKVSKALDEFSNLGLGSFILTCRSHYSIIELKCAVFQIEPFREDQIHNFVDSFLSIYEIRESSNELIEELKDRGFTDFLYNPLMLALVCVLKSSSLPSLPKNSIALIRRAIDTLTFRWDERKGVLRSAATTIDGEERVRCLMKVAFQLPELVGSETHVLNTVDEHLKLIQRTDASPEMVLREIAQWYGIFVPTSDGDWTFIHRTIHDFLAARYWVESGLFASTQTDDMSWDARTAYAACLTHDSTKYIVAALKHAEDISFVVECLSNGAPYDAEEVARAFFYRCRLNKYISGTVSNDGESRTINIYMAEDALSLFSKEVYFELIRISCLGDSLGHSIIYCLSDWQLSVRGVISTQLKESLNGFSAEIRRDGMDNVFYRLHLERSEIY